MLLVCQQIMNPILLYYQSRHPRYDTAIHLVFFGAVRPTFFKKYKSDANKWFGQIIKEAKKEGLEIKKIKTDIITTPVSVASAILEYAEKEDIDLIIVGTRGIQASREYY